jgi:hypothetical protein
MKVTTLKWQQVTVEYSKMTVGDSRIL